MTFQVPKAKKTKAFFLSNQKKPRTNVFRNPAGQQRQYIRGQSY